MKITRMVVSYTFNTDELGPNGRPICYQDGLVAANQSLDLDDAWGFAHGLCTNLEKILKKCIQEVYAKDNPSAGGNDSLPQPTPDSPVP